MRRRLLVVVVLVATLVLSTVAFQHSHDPAARSCDLCQVGHTPALQATGLAAVRSPQPIEWHSVTEQVHPDLEPLLASSPSRAPPA